MNRRFRTYRDKKRGHLKAYRTDTRVTKEEERSEFGAAARPGYEDRFKRSAPPAFPGVYPRAEEKTQKFPEDKGKENGRCNNGKCLRPIRPGIFFNSFYWCEKCARLLGAPLCPATPDAAAPK